MFKLPIVKIQTLLSSLDGTFVELRERLAYCLSWGRILPMLSICAVYMYILKHYKKVDNQMFDDWVALMNEYPID